MKPRKWWHRRIFHKVGRVITPLIGVIARLEPLRTGRNWIRANSGVVCGGTSCHEEGPVQPSLFNAEEMPIHSTGIRGFNRGGVFEVWYQGSIRSRHGSPVERATRCRITDPEGTSGYGVVYMVTAGDSLYMYRSKALNSDALKKRVESLRRHFPGKTPHFQVPYIPRKIWPSRN